MQKNIQKSFIHNLQSGVKSSEQNFSGEGTLKLCLKKG